MVDDEGYARAQAVDMVLPRTGQDVALGVDHLGMDEEVVHVPGARRDGDDDAVEERDPAVGHGVVDDRRGHDLDDRAWGAGGVLARGRGSVLACGGVLAWGVLGRSQARTRLAHAFPASRRPHPWAASLRDRTHRIPATALRLVTDRKWASFDRCESSPL